MFEKKMSVSFQSFWVEGAGNTAEIQTLLTLTLLLYALQILPLLVRPNLNKFAPSNITNSPPSISGRSQSFTSFPDKTSYETNSRIHFDGGEFAIGRNFHRTKQLNKNEITEAIGGYSQERKENYLLSALRWSMNLQKPTLLAATANQNVSYRNIRCGQHFSAWYNILQIKYFFLSLNE